MNNYINVLGIKIYYYGIIMGLALLIGIFIAEKKWKEKKMNIDIFNKMIVSILICSFVGARLWYVLFSGNLNYYFSNIINIINLKNGGLAIHGGILASILVIFYYSKKEKINFFQMTDIAVISLLLGQIIGRWGNFLNQEAHGPETTYEFLKNILHLPNFIIDGMNINGIYYQPTFLYESMLNLIGLIILIILSKKIKKIGFSTGFYLFWYGLVRMFIELLRTDALLLGQIKIAFLASFIMFVSGLYLMLRRKNEDNRI